MSPIYIEPLLKLVEDMQARSINQHATAEQIQRLSEPEKCFDGLLVKVQSGLSNTSGQATARNVTAPLSASSLSSQVTRW